MTSVSNCTLLSSVHGRERRELRNIGKHDLKAAVQYGKKERGRMVNGKIRWKYTFANITYITDETSKKEITSYVTPTTIHHIPMTIDDFHIHEKLRKQLIDTPWNCTSHTIAIIDQSASMRSCDVEEYRTRSDAVYGCMALDFIAKCIDEKETKGTDLLTLVEMRTVSQIVFDRVPITNYLYNKLVDKFYANYPSSHGNYLPALDLLNNILEKETPNPQCVVSVYFLSDGRPSDISYDSIFQKRLSPEDFESKVSSRIQLIGNNFFLTKPKQHLCFNSIGFGKDKSEFRILNKMAKKFESVGASSKFIYAGLSTKTLSSVITTIGTQLTSLRDTANYKSERNIPIIHDVKKLTNNGHFDPNEWYFAMKDVEILKYEKDENYQENWKTIDLMYKNSNGIAISKKAFAKGAERIVFLINELKNGKFHGDPIIGKESKYYTIDDQDKQLKFHECFCRSQLKAKRYAKKFNTKVESLLKLHELLKKQVVIDFLDCFVYSYKDEEGNDAYILSEKYLSNGDYKKWNSNNGGVYKNGSSINKTSSIGIGILDTIITMSSKSYEKGCEAATNEFDQIEISHYPQAFSHFTYRESRRNILICDLQGVLNDNISPPKFEFTDPAIHNMKTGTNKRHKFGRSDLGSNGKDAFFRSHKCNPLCNLLGLNE